VHKKQKGFTLIELVIVIVILGILSAFALPRFADLGGDARASTIQGVAGAMRSASAISRSACLASADCNESVADEEIVLEGETIALDFGYPTAALDGIILASQISGDEFDITVDGDAVTVGFDGRDNCEVEYTAATADDEASSVTTVLTGC